MTTEAAVKEALVRLPEDIKREIENTAKADLILFHDSVGRHIRNGLGLWKYAPERADEVSFRILGDVWEYLQSCGNHKDIL